MTKKEIKDARKKLPENSVFNSIINQKEGFYYYFNWMAGIENKLHYCECGHCAFGSGKRDDSENGKNGVWIGPFESRKIAKEALKIRFRLDHVQECGPCLNDPQSD